MKKIFILLGLFVSLSGFGQLLSAVVASDVPTYPDVTDGNTVVTYIADAAYMTIVSDSIMEWEDASGNDHDLLATVGVSSPEFAGDSVVFSGASSFLSTGSGHQMNPDTCTIYIVMSLQSSNLVYDLWSFGSPKMRESNSGTKLQVVPGYIATDEISFNDTQLLIVRIVEDGLSGIKWGDQDENTIDDIGTITPVDWLSVGSSSSAATQMSIKYFCVRDGDDSSATRLQKSAYLNYKYGL